MFRFSSFVSCMFVLFIFLFVTLSHFLPQEVACVFSFVWMYFIFHLFLISCALYQTFSLYLHLFFSRHVFRFSTSTSYHKLSSYLSAFQVAIFHPFSNSIIFCFTNTNVYLDRSFHLSIISFFFIITTYIFLAWYLFLCSPLTPST